MKKTTLIGLALTLSMGASYGADTGGTSSTDPYLDTSTNGNWPGYGRTYGEQHYSPLSAIDGNSVSKLGLVWSLDLPPANSVSAPVEADGIVYTSTGYSVVRAMDAATGKLLWTYDPKAAEASGDKLREGWGSRGLAWYKGKIYVGTQDGRLIALDGKTGREIWSAMTLEKEDYRFISGAPRAFDGKIIIGHGGADAANTRGYVTTYDAETGKQLWRFYLVPGNPANGFENKTMEMAAKTWSGQWWKYGGGATAWNTFSYDPDTDTVFVGTGNGAPWNHKIRSEGKGDNLFVCSIVALDAKTGAYKWHYQANPGESWDYNAAMDIQFADLMIDGKPRKVLMQAPKNGFFYVIDRVTGELISAEPITRVSWASKIDLKTGRPVENPAARYPNGTTFIMRPGPVGAHGWPPSSYSEKTKLIYIPVIDQSFSYSDAKIDKAHWTRPPGDQVSGAVTSFGVPPDGKSPDGTTYLLARDPATQKDIWKVATGAPWGGGVLTTGGNLVFEGRYDGNFDAYDAATGKLLWSFAAQAPVLAPPISYEVNGRQYVTVLTGVGTSAGFRYDILPFPTDYRSQARRVLTFALGGTGTLPKAEPYTPAAVSDPDYKEDKAAADRGAETYIHCLVCHGIDAHGTGAAPDLRSSPIPTSAEAFDSIVRQGALVSQGMPRFHELTDQEMRDVRQYIRSKAAELRKVTQ